jgi:hypothetical protein
MLPCRAVLQLLYFANCAQDHIHYREASTCTKALWVNASRAGPCMYILLPGLPSTILRTKRAFEKTLPTSFLLSYS